VSINTEEWVMPNVLTSSEILKYIKTKNPRVLIADSQIKLSLTNYKLARGLRLPILNSGLSFSAGGEKRNDFVKAFKEDWRFAIDFSLTLPIYSGNTLSLNEQKIKLSIRQAENNYITLINDLRVQAELIKELLNNYAEIIPLNESVVESSKEDLKLVTKRYALGSATILEVLDAQVSLTRSNSSLINVIYDARIKEFSLDALIGLLDTKYVRRDN
jgi:outer membrane protein TolC